LHHRFPVIACAECGADNDPTAHVCAACGAGLDNPAARALLGQIILGVYQLVDVIGKGGMSIVYKARHKMTDQVVALKILPAELAIHADIKARFIEEAKALARLEHPHIVRLYNFGEEAAGSSSPCNTSRASPSSGASSPPGGSTGATPSASSARCSRRSSSRTGAASSTATSSPPTSWCAPTARRW
jgi:hypothetical protein